MGIKERREREKKLRRRQIIDAVKKVCSEKSFRETTMDDIAREAEISPATIYLYFKSKEDLFASLSLGLLQFMNNKLEYVTNEKNQNPQQKLEALKEALYEVYESEPSILINMLHLQSNEILSNLSPNLLSDIKSLSRKSFNSMAKIFDEGINKGDFIRRNSMALADIIWSLFAGIVLWEESKKKIDIKKDHLRSTLEIAFEIFGSGIKICSETA
jgi:AcrR family transcriptional regulator